MAAVSIKSGNAGGRNGPKAVPDAQIQSWERSQALDAQLIETGAEEGIAFAFDRIERTPNTFDAHRLIWLAGEQGAQDAVMEALFQTYFIDARELATGSCWNRLRQAPVSIREPFSIATTAVARWRLRRPGPAARGSRAFHYL